MENKNAKEKIVRQLINQNIDIENEQELIEMLINEPIAIDVDKVNSEKLKFGDKIADALTKVAGSWTFIIGFCVFLMIWMILNNTILKEVDPYPFILLNLILSCLAALQAPIIMMSQNREAKKDSLRSKNDYKTDLKSELILEILHNQMSEIISNQKKIMKSLEKKGIECDTDENKRLF